MLMTLTTILAPMVVLLATSTDATSCQDICANHPLCATAKQGSYCKLHSDPVCFGFYEQVDGTVCYFQEDPTCDEAKPLPCPGLEKVSSALEVISTTKGPAETSTTVTEATPDQLLLSNSSANATANVLTVLAQILLHNATTNATETLPTVLVGVIH
jgi:hypothetical protein